MVNEGQQVSVNRTIEHEDIYTRCTGDKVVDFLQLQFRRCQHVWYAASSILVWKKTYDILRGGPQASAFVLLLVRHKSNVLFTKVVRICNSGHVMV